MSENLKKKSNKRVAIIVSAILALLLFCGGIGYAVAQMTASVTIGGNISFSAQHIYATVSTGTVTGNSSSDNVSDKMLELNFNANNSSNVDVSSWTGLTLSFDENASDITISFTITNNSTENELNITVGDIGGTYTNVTKSLKINGTEKTKDSEAVKLAKSGSETGKSAEVTITFSVTDKNIRASVSNFSFALTLANAIEA